MNDAKPEAASLLGPVRRWWWLILAIGVVAAVGTYEYYKHKTTTYTARTALYLGGTGEPGSGTGSSTKPTISSRALLDQVELINTSISERVHRRLRREGKRGIARAKGKAAPSANSDFITISTEAPTQFAAVGLANELAAAYIRTQRNQYVRSIMGQLATARQQLRRIETPSTPSGKGTSKATPPSASATIQAATLESHIAQLETSLSTFQGVQQVGTAKAAPVAVSPKRNAIFGFVVGLLAGCILAYLLSRLDRRMRGFSSVEELLQAPILAALPAVRSPTLRPGGVRAPAPGLIEPLRRLHAALRLSHTAPGRPGGPRVLLFISPDPGDGRSTLVANLGRVQRDSGERVCVVEADFRRPALGRLMGLEASRGLADVLAGTAPPHTAMQLVLGESQPPGSEPQYPGDGATAGVGTTTAIHSRADGVLSVLLSGGPAPNPPALLGSEAMARLLRTLGDEYDSVLIDVPCPLEFSDALPLLPLVEGVVIVARMGHTRIASAERMVQMLERTLSAPTLGVVVNGVARADIQRYGFYVAPTGPSQRRLIRR